MSKKLGKFSLSQLEAELLNRKVCQFNKKGCQKKATDYLIKKLGSWEIQRNPICDNCTEYIRNKLLKYEKN